MLSKVSNATYSFADGKFLRKRHYSFVRIYTIYQLYLFRISIFMCKYFVQASV